MMTPAQPAHVEAQKRGADAVAPRDHVRVLLDRGEVLAGRFVRFEEAGLVLEAGDHERFLAAEDIDRVWRYDDRRGDFALGGAIGGAVALGLRAALPVAAGCELGSCDIGKAALTGVTVGALAGGFAGLVAGAIASGWEEVRPGFRRSSVGRLPQVRVGLRPRPSTPRRVPAVAVSIPLPGAR